MPLSGDELEDFITTYQNAFNERITPEEAKELFSRLMDLYRRIQPVPDAHRDGQTQVEREPPA